MTRHTRISTRAKITEHGGVTESETPEQHIHAGGKKADLCLDTDDAYASFDNAIGWRVVRASWLHDTMYLHELGAHGFATP